MKKIIKICPICHSITEYQNTYDAERKTNINHSSISKAIRGIRITAGKFIWKETT